MKNITFNLQYVLIKNTLSEILKENNLVVNKRNCLTKIFGCVSQFVDSVGVSESDKHIRYEHFDY